jgi:molecular chaperone DnaK
MVLDATPLSFGVETIDGVMNVVIPRNTTIPMKTKDFTTIYVNQLSVEIKLYEGESALAKDRQSARRVRARRAPIGVPWIEVTFDISTRHHERVCGGQDGRGQEEHDYHLHQ